MALRFLGDQAAVHFVSRAARYAQLDVRSARLLLGFLVPITFASAKRLMKVRGYGSNVLASLVASEQVLSTPRINPLLSSAPVELRSASGPVGRPSAGLPVEHVTLGLDRLPVTKHGRFAAALMLVWSALLGYWALMLPQDVRRGVPEQTLSSRLSLSNIGSQIEYFGIVADEPSRSIILEILVDVFGESNMVGNLRVDSEALPPYWLRALRSAVLVARKPGVELRLSGNRVDVAGTLGDHDRLQLIESLRALFGRGFTVGSRNHDLGPHTLAELNAELTALGARPAFPDVVAVLEAWVINFPTESDEIPAEHRPLIRHAARLMNVLPDGTVIEVSGYTDDTGDSAVNLMLSRVRAESVREALIDAGARPTLLRVEGYGSERPVASNERPEGRRLNRRIEFSVTHD